MPDVLVMGAAIIHERRVLAARRAAPPELAGGWELPGGKVEPGEDPADGLTREIREELGCTIRITGVLPGAEPVRAGVVLRIATAELVAGEPVPHEHDALRWLAAEELHEVRWLAPDVPFLAAVADLLRGAGH